MTDIRVAAEQARAALNVAVETDLGARWLWPDSAKASWMQEARAALASLEAALQPQPFPVEAQAVPDLPVAHMHSSGEVCVDRMPESPTWPIPLFTRPTPAAADLWNWKPSYSESYPNSSRIKRLRIHHPDGSSQELVDASVAASPAAAEGVPIPRKVIELMLLAAADLEGWAKTYGDGVSKDTAARLRQAAIASPVAPVGAPTRLTDEQGNHSVHLAGGDAGQDFRDGSALSEPQRIWRAIGEEAECVVQRGTKYLLLSEEMCVRLGAALGM